MIPIAFVVPSLSGRVGISGHKESAENTGMDFAGIENDRRTARVDNTPLRISSHTLPTPFLSRHCPVLHFQSTWHEELQKNCRVWEHVRRP